MRLSRYASEAKRLGLRVLDIYRLKEKEILRCVYRGKVVLIELSRYRDSMDLETFRKEIQSKIPS